MPSLTIFTDCNLGDSARKLLTNGLSGHELVQPQKKSSSILSTSETDLGFFQADIVLGQPQTQTVFASEKLRWLQIPTAGYTRYDTDEFRQGARARGVIVTNSSRVYEEACAEHLLSFMLAESRCLPASLKAQASGNLEEYHSIRRHCRTLRDQNVLILGYGSIAEKLLRLLAPFDMKIKAFRRKARGDELVSVVQEKELPGALAVADHVINILPDNEQSRHFFHAGRFSQIRKGAVFYNIGRGSTVDQDALVETLRSKHLASAWLDVTEPEPLPAGHPLLSLENCYITPHSGGGHQNESETLVRHFLDNFQRFLIDQPLHNRII